LIFILFAYKIEFSWYKYIFVAVDGILRMASHGKESKNKKCAYFYIMSSGLHCSKVKRNWIIHTGGELNCGRAAAERKTMNIFKDFKP
jgi:hypothetical protein